jgi:hypothetical protein
MTLSVGEKATLFICRDSKLTQVPAWMSQFEDVSHDKDVNELSVSVQGGGFLDSFRGHLNERKLQIYKCKMCIGVEVNLYGNAAHAEGFCNYFVVVVPESVRSREGNLFVKMKQHTFVLSNLKLTGLPHSHSRDGMYLKCKMRFLEIKSQELKASAAGCGDVCEWSKPIEFRVLNGINAEKDQLNISLRQKNFLSRTVLGSADIVLKDLIQKWKSAEAEERILALGETGRAAMEKFVLSNHTIHAPLRERSHVFKSGADASSNYEVQGWEKLSELLGAENNGGGGGNANCFIVPTANTPEALGMGDNRVVFALQFHVACKVFVCLDISRFEGESSETYKLPAWIAEDGWERTDATIRLQKVLVRGDKKQGSENKSQNMVTCRLWSRTILPGEMPFKGLGLVGTKPTTGFSSLNAAVQRRPSLLSSLNPRAAVETVPKTGINYFVLFAPHVPPPPSTDLGISENLRTSARTTTPTPRTSGPFGHSLVSWNSSMPVQESLGRVSFDLEMKAEYTKMILEIYENERWRLHRGWCSGNLHQNADTVYRWSSLDHKATSFSFEVCVYVCVCVCCCVVVRLLFVCTVPVPRT